MLLVYLTAYGNRQFDFFECFECFAYAYALFLPNNNQCNSIIISTFIFEILLKNTKNHTRHVYVVPQDCRIVSAELKRSGMVQREKGIIIPSPDEGWSTTTPRVDN